MTEADDAWTFPDCLPPEFNKELLKTLDYFFQLLAARLQDSNKSGNKETQALEDECRFLESRLPHIDGGDEMMARNCGCVYSGAKILL